MWVLQEVEVREESVSEHELPSMNHELDTNFFFALVRLGIGTARATDECCLTLLTLPMEQWQDMMLLAERQGVAAVAFDGVQKLYEVYQRDIQAVRERPSEWMQMVFESTSSMTQYEIMNKKQKEVICKIAEIWAAQGVRMMVFKGQANASFYPVPEHRSVGDIDCYLFGDADMGDKILEDKGATVENCWYRHSKILFCGETIENHRVMSHTRGSKRKKEMEKGLIALLDSANLNRITGCGEALLPPAQFNAHFLIYHALHHFTSEGMRMKQILDWAVFLQTQHDKVDWTAFDNFCKQYKLDRFAALMNYIVREYLGVECHTDFIDAIDENGSAPLKNSQKPVKKPNIEELAEKVLRSTLYDDDYLFNSGKSDWTVRWLLVRNMFGRDRWKYEDIAQDNIWSRLWHNTSGFLMGKD